MTEADDNVDADDGVRLKVQGKRWRCRAPKGRGLCGNQTVREIPILTHGGLPHRRMFECCACDTIIDGLAEDFEVLLPPRNDWRTPGGSVFAPVRDGLWTNLHAEFRFDLDVAADVANRKTEAFFDGTTPERDALLQPWFVNGRPARAFDNPPYNPKGSVELWLRRGLAQAALGVFSVHLVPMASSVAWFNDIVIPYCQWRTFRGRIAFEDPLAKEDDPRTSPKQDNLLVIMDPDSTRHGHTGVHDARTGARLA